ncbi:STM3941 family protein [Streptomyces sp. NPDC001356]|uniref:STM3941 family protein n=1 Tax=Streptomyces spinosus TaxID=2872623 RepID=UPI001CECAE7F|nr:STM3941 family protein [Streptomyces spinosus]
MNEKAAPLPPTVFPLAKGRVWAMLAGSLVFVVLGIVFLVAHSTVKMTVAGALAVLFFGFCSVSYVRRLLRGRPELVLDDAGVDHVSLGRFGWDEIAAVRIREQRVRTTSQRFIELVLHDPDAYLARAPRLVRRTAPANARLGLGPANMAVNTLPAPPEAVLDAMRRHCPGLPVQR